MFHSHMKIEWDLLSKNLPMIHTILQQWSANSSDGASAPLCLSVSLFHISVHVQFRLILNRNVWNEF